MAGYVCSLSNVKFVHIESRNGIWAFRLSPLKKEVIKEMLRNLYYAKNNCNEFSQIIMYSREKFSWHF